MNLRQPVIKVPNPRDEFQNKEIRSQYGRIFIYVEREDNEKTFYI